MRKLLALRTIAQAFLCQDFSHVIDMEAVNHAGTLFGVLNDGDVSVAVIIPRGCAVIAVFAYKSHILMRMRTPMM